jgi:hypothetical protein
LGSVEISRKVKSRDKSDPTQPTDTDQTFTPTIDNF